MLCDRCGLVFPSFAALVSHARWKHVNPLVHKCEVCFKEFSNSYALKRHCEKPHSNENTSLCAICNYSGRKSQLKEHFKEHKIYLEEEMKSFSNSGDFFRWKENVECVTKSRFVKHRAPRLNKNGTSITEYYCHRDGWFKSKSKGQRALKVLGSNKINGYCPAAIVAHEAPNCITVKFIKTHVGHGNEIGRLSLTKAEKDKIASKIAMKVPIDEILDELRDSIDEGSVSRTHLTTRKDIHNIIKMYNLNHDAVWQKRDTMSLDNWVRQMQEESSVVRLYKPQNAVDPCYPQLTEEDFCLILAKESQIELLKKYGNEGICIDRSTETNAGCELYAILVVDEVKECFPCAFMICNRSDSIVMELFFRTTFKCLGSESIDPKWLMTDMADSFFKGWSAACTSSTKHLFSGWHVDQVWRQNLKKINSKELQVETYNKLKVLMYEREKNTFSIMLNDVFEELHSQEETRKFALYIESFFNDPQKWAFCYRLEGCVDTNMILENISKIIKYIYLRRSKARRLDKAISALMRFLRDRACDRFIAAGREKVTKKLAALRARHKSSLELTNCWVTVAGSMKWNVISSDVNEICEVSKMEVTCKCDLHCEECGACIHDFNCTCADASIHWNMCKHIHLVCRLLKEPTGISEGQPAPILYDNDDVIEEIYSVEDLPNLNERKSIELEKIKEVLHSVTSEEELVAFQEHVAPLAHIIEGVKEKGLSNATITVIEPPFKKPCTKVVNFPVQNIPVCKVIIKTSSRKASELTAAMVLGTLRSSVDTQ